MTERELKLEAVAIWQKLILQSKQKYQWWEL